MLLIFVVQVEFFRCSFKEVENFFLLFNLKKQQKKIGKKKINFRLFCSQEIRNFCCWQEIAILVKDFFFWQLKLQISSLLESLVFFWIWHFHNELMREIIQSNAFDSFLDRFQNWLSLRVFPLWNAFYYWCQKICPQCHPVSVFRCESPSLSPNSTYLIILLILLLLLLLWAIFASNVYF